MLFHGGVGYSWQATVYAKVKYISWNVKCVGGGGGSLSKQKGRTRRQTRRRSRKSQARRTGANFVSCPCMSN